MVKAPVHGYTVANFSETSELRPPAFDLVALLRSLDYAAGYAFLARTGALDPKATPSTLGATGLVDDDLIAQVDGAPEARWSHESQKALLAGYSHVGGADFSMKDPVLRAMLIDRLLVEVVSELRNRPTWLIVPLSELRRLLTTDTEVAAEPARLNPRTSTEATRAGIEERLAEHRKAQEEKVAHARAAAAKARQENDRLVEASQVAKKAGHGIEAPVANNAEAEVQEAEVEVQDAEVADSEEPTKEPQGAGGSRAVTPRPSSETPASGDESTAVPATFDPADDPVDDIVDDTDGEIEPPFAPKSARTLR